MYDENRMVSLVERNPPLPQSLGEPLSPRHAERSDSVARLGVSRTQSVQNVGVEPSDGRIGGDRLPTMGDSGPSDRHPRGRHEGRPQCGKGLVGRLTEISLVDRVERRRFGELGQGRETAGNPGSISGFHQRKQFATDPVPQIPGLEIRRIFAPLEPTSAGVSFEPGAGNVEEGANVAPPDRRHSFQPPTPDEPEEHRLRLVIPMVPQEDPARVEVFAHRGQRRISRAPKAGFVVPDTLQPDDPVLEPFALAQIRDEVRVCGATRPNSVVHVSDGEASGAQPVQEEVEQDHRVETARARDDRPGRPPVQARERSVEGGPLHDASLPQPPARVGHERSKTEAIEPEGRVGF